MKRNLKLLRGSAGRESWATGDRVRALRLTTLLPLLLAVVLCGCRPSRVPARSALDSAPLGLPRFAEVTRAAGLSWTHNPCRTGRKYLPETMGAGGGFLDYDQDGKLDILLINGAPLPGYRGPVPRHALYRNSGSGRFTDVTHQAGLSAREYGMGAAVGDYDSDGWPDLYLTAVGRNRLYRNDRGRFVDVTESAGVGDSHWSTGAAWVDYDRDGHLDLFVGNYVEWSPSTDLPCGSERERQYCPPYQYRGAPSTLYRNRGNGTFQDVSRQAGVLGHPSKTLAVTPCDANDDGWPDLHLANDTEPDVLLVNRQDGTFVDEAVSYGVAVGADGRATGSMGVDIAAPFNDGRSCIAVGNFVGQGLSLFCALPESGPERVFYENAQHEAGVAGPTRSMSTFGLCFSDIDLDGWLDLLALNGHLDENLAAARRGEAYRQLPQLFQNQRNGRFQDTARSAGLTSPMVGRALAAGDYDDDGRQDFLAFENGGPVRLWHNQTRPAGGWVGVELAGVRSPRDGAGAVVTLTGLRWTQRRLVSTTRSYLAVNDPRVHFGVGSATLERLTVRWPSGVVDTVEAPPLNRYLRIEEGRGVTPR
jgi:enediyne biosynthesis protein E4